MVVAATIFAVLVTGVATACWILIRWLRKRTYRAGGAIIGIAIVSLLVGGIDTSMGGKSGLLSIFAPYAAMAYMGGILLLAAAVAAFLR